MIPDVTDDDVMMTSLELTCSRKWRERLMYLDSVSRVPHAPDLPTRSDLQTDRGAHLPLITGATPTNYRELLTNYGYTLLITGVTH